MILNKDTQIDLPKVTRVEVIDDNGRVLVRHGVKAVYASLQDDGRTIKIFYSQ